MRVMTLVIIAGLFWSKWKLWRRGRRLYRAGFIYNNRKKAVKDVLTVR